MAVKRTRGSVVCVDAGALLCVRLRDPVSKIARLYMPGGGVEAGELPLRTAVRETLEETGYLVLPEEAGAQCIRYPFLWAGVDVDVTTHFFRARLASARDQPAPVDDADYNEGTVWLPLDQVEAELAFHAEISATVRGLL